MKLNIIILLIFIISVSCYQAPESSSGSIAVKINTDLMRGAPAGYDGVLRLAVFGENDLDSLVYISSNPDISYLGDFPPALLANNLVPILGRSGEIALLNVPSDTKLKLLVERDGQEYYDGFGSDYYFHSHSGLSNTFEVEGGKTADVTVDLVPTTDGSVSVDFTGVFNTQFYAKFLDPDDFNSLVTLLPGDEIDYDSGNVNTAALDNFQVLSTPAYPSTHPALPGKKMRIIVSTYNSPNAYDDVGVSEIFELQPGRTLSVPFNYYEYFDPYC